MDPILNKYYYIILLLLYYADKTSRLIYSPIKCSSFMCRAPRKGTPSPNREYHGRAD